MNNVILTHRIEQNKKYNRIAKFGYFIAAMFDPYGFVSLVFGGLLWFKGASNKQVGGFGANMLIHIVATAIFNRYFNSLTGTVVYSIVFATAVPFILYRLTAASTLQLIESPVFYQDPRVKL